MNEAANKAAQFAWGDRLIEGLKSTKGSVRRENFRAVVPQNNFVGFSCWLCQVRGDPTATLQPTKSIAALSQRNASRILYYCVRTGSNESTPPSVKL